MENDVQCCHVGTNCEFLNSQIVLQICAQTNFEFTALYLRHHWSLGLQTKSFSRSTISLGELSGRLTFLKQSFCSYWTTIEKKNYKITWSNRCGKEGSRISLNPLIFNRKLFLTFCWTISTLDPPRKLTSLKKWSFAEYFQLKGQPDSTRFRRKVKKFQLTFESSHSENCKSTLFETKRHKWTRFWDKLDSNSKLRIREWANQHRLSFEVIVTTRWLAIIFFHRRLPWSLEKFAHGRFFSFKLRGPYSTKLRSKSKWTSHFDQSVRVFIYITWYCWIHKLPR